MQVSGQHWISTDGARAAKKIITAVKRNSETEEREIGIEPSLLDDEIRNYLAQVMDELKKNSKYNFCSLSQMTGEIYFSLAKRALLPD
jgi:hypothetical protein